MSLVNRRGRGHAAWTSDRIIELGGNAWQWMGWAGPDPETGAITRWPAEYFGPVPVSRVTYED